MSTLGLFTSTYICPITDEKRQKYLTNIPLASGFNNPNNFLVINVNLQKYYNDHFIIYPIPEYLKTDNFNNIYGIFRMYVKNGSSLSKYDNKLIELPYGSIYYLFMNYICKIPNVPYSEIDNYRNQLKLCQIKDQYAIDIDGDTLMIPVDILDIH